MLETELRKTKEFLEKMIDSTVDGIVAADIRGMVILFNPGAERVFGYSADEVVGKLPVWKLYAEGVPQQIMRMLRDGRHGGVGRLEETRREIVTKAGELVPVNMTASIIYEDDVEVATVGIFSDLRERIRIEQRLLKAQEDLEHSEKNALVAQLAGTAAHELNQPLTSIMGYAQLVARQLEGEAAGARAVDIILREAERMAEIVRKIGRITQFETKEYVGSASIIDLDKSAPAPPQFGAPIEKSAEAVPEPMPIEDTRPNPTGSASEAGSPVVQAPVVDESSRRTMKVSRLVVEQGEEVSTQKRTLKIPRLDKDGNPIR
ncbi:MAG: PAS domain S-box protein, partial [Deltaproteobacteria bacterium]|nr:PAS domain S-box protein [Deltaproteobacteria bacterium]